MHLWCLLMTDNFLPFVSLRVVALWSIILPIPTATMTTHYLKCLPEHFNRSASGLKNYEIRLNDRNFQIGDRIVLREYDLAENSYLGRELERKIEHILYGGQFGLDSEHVILELSV
ncbi:DUF3850 domain-containing protein [Dyadobacter luticola]|uniref:DUF3850 domain-containing protein n=2 Tax=Dyadobacter luticola TaxID=1979387 RepID=A0A5R9L2D6_9BACT|nr:DUF3850 domain-containing protein [Dyadobacter luticola]